MDKQFYSKGFTLAEMLIVLVLITVLYGMSVPVVSLSLTSHFFVFDYFEIQAKAIASSTNQAYTNHQFAVYFNDKGNVRQAQTLFVDNVEFISNLGGGRLVKK